MDPSPYDTPGDRHRASAPRLLDPPGGADDLAVILHSSSEAVFRQDDTTAISVWNKAACRLLGRAETEMAGSHLGTHLTGDDHARWADAVAHARAGGRSEGVRLDLHRADGQISPVLLTITPAPTTHGGDAGAWVVARDLTEQILAQKTLAESELRVRRSEVLAGTGSFVIDAAAGAVQWSPGMYAIFGVTPRDFEPSVDAHVALVHPEDRETVAATLRRASEGGPAGELDHRIMLTDGTVDWVFLAVEATLDATGQVIGASGVCQNVTHRKESEAAAQTALERERTAIEELRRLDAVKEEFLATVSHELRTPLTAILGFSALLREVGDTRDDLLAPIERNAKDMHQMVERLLDYSRLEAGRVAIEPRPLRLGEQIPAIVDQVGSALTGHRVHFDIDPDVVVLADLDALERILVNLISNAAKYSDPPGTIDISVETQDWRVIVSVSDDGPGIAPEHHTQVFERFFRVPGQTAAKRGTGVGLAIVRQYVELHGGKVWVESAPGSRTSFRFELPRGGTP